MILRILAALVALTLATGAALILAATPPSGTPDGSPSRPYPSVTPFPGGWKP